ncbi:hypothetical protein G6F56_007576 [Rhizopus delemar]|nr:hypothetical protein G6F56_007576 [Rhizopus delemar]
MPLPPLPTTECKKASGQDESDDYTTQTGLSSLIDTFILNESNEPKIEEQEPNAYISSTDNRVIILTPAYPFDPDSPMSSGSSSSSSYLASMSSGSFNYLSYVSSGSSSSVSLVLNESNNALKFPDNRDFWEVIAKGESNQNKINTLVSKYLRCGGDPNITQPFDITDTLKKGYSLVHTLIIANCTESLKLVLKVGGNPNQISTTTQTKGQIAPLVLAARENNFECVVLLVEYGARMFDSKGPDGESALHAAIQCRSEKTISFLVQIQRRLIEIPDDLGVYPLHYAVMEGDIRVVTMIAEKANLDVRDKTGKSPLQYAIRQYRLDIIKVLMDMGADTQSLDKKGNDQSKIVCYLKRFRNKTSSHPEREKTACQSIDKSESNNSSIAH